MNWDRLIAEILFLAMLVWSLTGVTHADPRRRSIHRSRRRMTLRTAHPP